MRSLAGLKFTACGPHDSGDKVLGRSVDYATFYLSAAWRLWRLARRGDVIVAKTDPPMLSIIAAPIAFLRGAKLVNWLQDVFPEVAQQLGVRQGRGALGSRALRWLRTARSSARP